MIIEKRNSNNFIYSSGVHDDYAHKSGRTRK